MKLSLFLYVILSASFTVKAQSLSGYIPSKETGSIKSIADYVIANYKTDAEKLSAVYHWVTNNIRYDKDSMYNINWATDLETKAAATLRRRKGVCENYASIFTDIILKCSIPSYVVTGYTNQAGFGKNTGHSWSAVFLDNKWLLCDPTWDVGIGNRTNYFLISPETFIDSHTPFDPLWQLLPPSYSNRNLKVDNNSYQEVNAEVQSFLQLDSLQQLEASSQRMLQLNKQTEQQKNWRSYVKMQIAIVHGEEDMNLYNAAVADLNNANKIFNNFVLYRNNQFVPYKSEVEVNAMLEPVYGLLVFAKTKLNKIRKVVENDQYNTELIQQKISSLTQRVKEQKDFLKSYFANTLADRGKLFYK